MIGSSDAARLAGHTPNNTPTVAEKTNASTTDEMSTVVLNPPSLLNAHAPPAAEHHSDESAKQTEHDRLDQELKAVSRPSLRQVLFALRSRGFAPSPTRA